jgi:uncharacterized ion transporter superfamily protein YfcC
MIYGFIAWNDLWQEGWGRDFPLPTSASFYFPEAAALFIVMAVVIGLKGPEHDEHLPAR